MQKADLIQWWEIRDKGLFLSSLIKEILGGKP